MNESTKTETPAATTPGGPADFQARYERALERRAEKDKAAEQARRMRLVELEELEERLERELGGPRGSKFDIVDTVEGPIAVQLGPSVLHKRFRESKMGEPDVHDFVAPCVVHPEVARFNEIASVRPGVLVDVANVLADLYAAKTEVVAGKR